MLLKKLTETHGISGDERIIRDFILEEIKPYIDEFKIDSLGNLIAVKHGKPGYPKVMLSAHTDEVGLIVKSIDDQGFIKFMPVGGIDDRLLVSKVVEIGKNKVKGVIGAKAIHLQEPEERNTALKHKNLYIDIGASSKEDAESKVSRGDYIAFVSEYIEFGDGLIKAKGLDDRAGCAMIMNLLKNDYNSTIYAAFTVQEEVGLRGATVAAYKINPDLAIVLEGTTCYDVTGVEEPFFATRIGMGPALSIVDSSTYFNKKLNQKLISISEENNIKMQFKQTTKGGNDAGKIHLSRGGIPTLSLSVPCRYIHSPVSVMHRDDFENAIKLIDIFVKTIEKEEYINE